MGIAVQAQPAAWPMPVRLSALAGFWVLPFAMGTLRVREMRGMLPGSAVEAARK
jgi:hypothetical protein